MKDEKNPGKNHKIKWLIIAVNDYSESLNLSHAKCGYCYVLSIKASSLALEIKND